MKLSQIVTISAFALALSVVPAFASTSGSGKDCGKGNNYHSSGKGDPSCHKGGDNGGGDGNGGGNNGGGNGGSGNGGNGGSGGQGGNGGNGGQGGNGGSGGTGIGQGGHGGTGIGTGVGIGVGVGQGGSASATGGSVSNSGNSSNSNTNNSTSGASAGATAGASNNSSGNTLSTSSTYNEVRQTPMAYAPDALPTSPCFKTYSAGASSPFFGAALGGGRIDKGCDARETARSFALLHNFTAAAKLLCSTDAAKRAKLTLDDCLAFVVEPAPVAPVAPAVSQEPTVVVVPLTTPAPVAPAPVAPAVAVTPAPVATPFETKKISQ